ncbi:mechanosensitive ion channel family protein [Lyngbya aestuarii BL J]|uniref:Mechanosensitive ion channel family protein n=1 Tax=Lyngbya aestuarii BL J TaxID=1348334 RepID=U7QC35_9CYAN|nr:mechanosensitive ion channel family protein [Lyngbya aestuarii]ERT05399.1 mechanosensitive ion channel family protein [Lyngbya aestuarii BL J]
MPKLVDIHIGIIQTLQAFSSHLRSRLYRPMRFVSISLLTFILIITGIPTATAQFPIPISVESGDKSGTPIFNALNKPFNCVNLQFCSNVWMTGSTEPVLKLASPPATETQEENTTLPVELRARKIQRQLNLIQEKAQDRVKSNPPNSEISLNKNKNKKNSAKQIILEQSRGTPIGKKLTSQSESLGESLHPDTPKIEVALENNIPVIYLPAQEGFLKQTLLTVREWDVIPNQDVLIPDDNPEMLEQIKQWRQEITENFPNFSYEKTEALVLAKIWQSRIQQQFSRALKRQETVNDNIVDIVAFFLGIISIIVLLSLIFFWIKRQVKARRRKLRKQLEDLEKSVAIEPDTTSEELVAKAAEAEEAINAAKNQDSTQNEPSSARFSNRNNSSGDLADIPFELVSSSMESIWRYITQSSLKQQSILKQQINLMLLLENILFWVQIIVLVFGIAALLFFYPPTRVYAVLLIKSPIWIALIWIVLSITDKVVDFFIDSLLNRWATEAQQTSSTPQRYTMRVKTYSAALSQLTSVIAYGLATILSLSVLGLSTEGLASAGVITLIATYIFQPHITNVIRGCLILLTDQFAVGDVIVVGSVSGFVERMNLYMTHLRGEEGRLISIPNANIDVVQNLTKEWSRVDFKIEIAYDADVKHALEVIHKVAEEMRSEPQWQDLMIEPASILGVDGITHNGVLIQVWIKTQPIQQWAVGREFRLRIKLAFDREGIAIGMPQRLLWRHDNESSNPDSNGYHSEFQHSSQESDN